MNTNYENILLQCADCGCEFDFSPEEQEFYGEKGFTQPKRCAACRSQNRQRKNSGGRSGGGGGGGRGGGRPQIRHEVVCSACGIQTTVPFIPSQDKPVYCPDCYKKEKGETW